MTNPSLPPIATHFTDQLLPCAVNTSTRSGEDAVLPLIQRWVLALMLAADKSYKLFAEVRLRKFFKIGMRLPLILEFL